MPLLLPVLLLVLLFAAALLAWPFTLWRRVRTGHLRRRVVLWPFRVRRVLLLVSTVLFTGIAVALAGGWAAPASRELALALALGAAAGLLAGALARVDVEGGALYLAPNRWMVLAVALALLARLAWVALDWMQGDPAARGHAVALGGALLGFATAHSATLARRLGRALACARRGLPSP